MLIENTDFVWCKLGSMRWKKNLAVRSLEPITNRLLILGEHGVWHYATTVRTLLMRLLLIKVWGLLFKGATIDFGIKVLAWLTTRLWFWNASLSRFRSFWRIYLWPKTAKYRPTQKFWVKMLVFVKFSMLFLMLWRTTTAYLFSVQVSSSLHGTTSQYARPVMR